jgi:hypothetical protein
MKIARRFQRRVAAEREEPRPGGTPELRPINSCAAISIVPTARLGTRARLPPVNGRAILNGPSGTVSRCAGHQELPRRNQNLGRAALGGPAGGCPHIVAKAESRGLRSEV